MYVMDIAWGLFVSVYDFGFVLDSFVCLLGWCVDGQRGCVPPLRAVLWKDSTDRHAMKMSNLGISDTGLCLLHLGFIGVSEVLTVVVPWLTHGHCCL